MHFELSYFYSSYQEVVMQLGMNQMIPQIFNMQLGPYFELSSSRWKQLCQTVFRALCSKLQHYDALIISHITQPKSCQLAACIILPNVSLQGVCWSIFGWYQGAHMIQHLMIVYSYHHLSFRINIPLCSIVSLSSSYWYIYANMRLSLTGIYARLRFTLTGIYARLRFTLKLNQYHAQEMFGDPVRRPTQCNVLPLIWTYLVKNDGTKKAQCVYNGSPT